MLLVLAKRNIFPSISRFSAASEKYDKSVRGKGWKMKRYRNRIKNNILYYWSVIDLTITGLACHIVHFVKTGRLPQKRTKYSQDEIREELRKIAEEIDMEDKEAPVEGPGPME